MSVAGFDVGDQCTCIAVARKRGIDVLMNKESKRESPSVIAFNTKQRLLGTAAVGSLSTSPRNTVFQIKRLLGKKFSNPDVQRDISMFPFRVSEGSDGRCLITVDYLGEQTQLTPEQLLAMVLVDQKEIAETDGSPVTDCVISVPTYFTEAERYATLNAAQIAGVNCLRLFNDTTSTALSYGIYKTDLPETDSVNVAFVDVGFSAFQVCSNRDVGNQHNVWMFELHVLSVCIAWYCASLGTLTLNGLHRLHTFHLASAQRFIYRCQPER